MGNRHQAAAGIAAEVSDPSVVGDAIDLRQLDVVNFGLPKNSQGRVEDRLGQFLLVEQLEPLLGVHRAERRAPHVSTLRARLQLLTAAAHPTEQPEESRHSLLGYLAVVLQAFEPRLVLDDLDRPRLVLMLKVVLPQAGRFEDMAVSVDYQLGWHVKSPWRSIKRSFNAAHPGFSRLERARQWRRFSVTVARASRPRTKLAAIE